MSKKSTALHIAYRLTKNTAPYGILEDTYDSSVSTNLSYKRDGRGKVWIPSLMLNIWGFE